MSTQNAKVENALLARVLADPHAPQGDVTADLKTALYAAACLSPLNSDPQRDFKSGKLKERLKFAAGFELPRGQRLSLAQCRKYLDELVAEGALVQVGTDYMRAADAKPMVLEVKCRREKLYDDFYSLTLYVTAGNEEYELSRPSDLLVLPGDQASVILSRDKHLACVQDIVKARRCLLGTIASGRTPRLLPQDPTLGGNDFVFSPDSLGDAKPGNTVIAEIVSRSSDGRCAVRVREVIHGLGRLSYVITKAVVNNNIPSVWPHNMQRALARIPDKVGPEDIKGRKDLRDLPLVTIDGEDARDFDDAVYAVKEGANFRLYVAIADVSYYVRTGTVLDREAVQRCNSVYFPNYVIPMLPEKLSNGICSLNPSVDRLCMVCEMEIDRKGRTTAYKFYPAVMNSHARLTYTEAWQMITEGTTNIPEHQAVIEDVKTLHELYQILAKARDLRGGFAVESEEVNFVFNENLKIVGLTPVVRNDAHKLIEECMIAANVAAASFIAENKAQTLYRVHAKPMPEKLASLRASLVRFGLSLPGADNPSPQDYNTFCHAIEKRQDAPLLGQLLLRSMSKAEYSPQNIGHFGLALSTYAHFTSPIRRYADLQLHRSIKFLLEHGNKDARAKLGARSYNKTELMSLGERCTEREIAADHAEFDVDNELKCILVSRYVGKVVDGTVSAVTSFGAFIHLDDFMVDGLLFIGNISDEYVSYNERTQSLMGGGVEIRMGDKLKVQIGSVNPAERKIDLLLPEIKKSRQGKTQPLQSDVTRADLIKEQQGAPDVRGETDRLLNSLSDLISNDPAPKQEANQAALAEAKKQVQDEKPAEKKPRRKKTAAAVDKTSEPAEAAESAAEPAVEAAPQPKVKSAKSALKQMMKQAGRSAVKLAAKAGLVSREKAGLTPAEEAKPAAETVQETLRLLDRPLTLGDLIRLGLTRYDPSLEPEGATKGKKRKGKKKNKKKKDKKNGK